VHASPTPQPGGFIGRDNALLHAFEARIAHGSYSTGRDHLNGHAGKREADPV